jgi:hypothetical protein
MANNEIEAVICPAPEFYGKTKGFTNMMVFENLKKVKSEGILKDDVLRTLILLRC